MSPVSVELPPGFPGLDGEGAARIRAEGPPELPAAAPPGVALSMDRVTAEGGLTGCAACGHAELFTRVDFDRRLGIAVVVVAALLAPFTWYLSLVAAAILDAVLYRLSPEVVSCYVCGADHRGFIDRPRHPRFDREIDERLRYGAKAVMGKPMRESGTADAPEPEH